MNGVNKTLYIPLYGKAYVSRKGLFIKDTKAEEIWEKEEFPLKRRSKSKYLAYYMGVRCAVFDAWLKRQLENSKNAAVIHIGCGMDSRVLRVEHANVKWYDVDFPGVIDERKRYYAETGNYRMIGADMRNSAWLEEIPETKCAVVVLEGVSMYMPAEELKSAIAALCGHFDRVRMLMDCYTVFAAKASKYKNPINDVGAGRVYGIDRPEILEGGGFVFVKEHDMTPESLTGQLCGAEKFIFQKLYAGKISKKLYRLFEYKSEKT